FIRENYSLILGHFYFGILGHYHFGGTGMRPRFPFLLTHNRLFSIVSARKQLFHNCYSLSV
ncbi:MAG: hypothetical protein ACLQBC_16415, partial [Syntrophales bacterium]